MGRRRVSAPMVSLPRCQSQLPPRDGLGLDFGESGYSVCFDRIHARAAKIAPLMVDGVAVTEGTDGHSRQIPTIQDYIGATCDGRPIARHDQYGRPHRSGSSPEMSATIEDGNRRVRIYGRSPKAIAYLRCATAPSETTEPQRATACDCRCQQPDSTAGQAGPHLRVLAIAVLSRAPGPFDLVELTTRLAGPTASRMCHRSDAIQCGRGGPLVQASGCL